MLKSLSNSLLARGILAVVVGIVALAWPQITVVALVAVFAVYAFMAAGLDAMRAFRGDSGGSVVGHLLLAAIDVAAGVIALAWPVPTALVLVLIVATWAVVGGLAEFALGFRTHERAGTRALFIVGGLVSVAFGVVLFARPAMGAITLALLFGLFNLMAGTWMVLEGIELRHGRSTLRSIVTKPHVTAA